MGASHASTAPGSTRVGAGFGRLEDHALQQSRPSRDRVIEENRVRDHRRAPRPGMNAGDSLLQHGGKADIPPSTRSGVDAAAPSLARFSRPPWRSGRTNERVGFYFSKLLTRSVGTLCRWACRGSEGALTSMRARTAGGNMNRGHVAGRQSASEHGNAVIDWEGRVEQDVAHHALVMEMRGRPPFDKGLRVP